MNRESPYPNVLGPIYESTPPPDQGEGSKSGRDVEPALPRPQEPKPDPKGS